MTDKKLKELEDCTKTYELIQPNAHVTKMLRLALDEINSLRNKVDSLTPKEDFNYVNLLHDKRNPVLHL